MKKIRNILCLLLVIVLPFCFLTGCKNKNLITIGHKDYTEARVLGQLFAVMIEENTEYDTEVKELGGSSLVWEALKSNKIDLYPEYTGTTYSTIYSQNGESDPEIVYNYVKEQCRKDFGIIWGEPLGYNNTYALAVTSDVASQNGLETVSDLMEVADSLKIAAEAEFLEREDGLPGLKKVYKGLHFAEEIQMNVGLRYQALNEGQAEVTDAYSTDGKLLQYGFKVLEDDKGFFPPYYVAPIFNGDFYESHKDIYDVLNQLKNQVSEDEIMQMNYKVGTEGKDAEEVVRTFLTEKNLI